MGEGGAWWGSLPCAKCSTAVQVIRWEDDGGLEGWGRRMSRWGWELLGGCGCDEGWLARRERTLAAA